MCALQPVALIVLLAAQTPQIKTVEIDDILNAEYLPSTLLLEEAEVDHALPHPLLNISTDGQIRDAFRTMHYHRYKGVFMILHYQNRSPKIVNIFLAFRFKSHPSIL